jgi:small subunit ribosomal protein S5
MSEDKKTNETKANNAEAKTEAVAAENKDKKTEVPATDAAKVEKVDGKQTPTVEGKAPAEEFKANRKPNEGKFNSAAGGAKRKFGGGPGGKKKDNRRQKRSDQAEPSEYTEKVVQVRRVTKVVKGGKKLSFRVVVIIGNEKNKVGVGVGKASEVLGAIRKAVSDAKKNVIEVPLVGTTISHKIFGEAGGAKIMLKPAADGTGIIAGGTPRIVLELAGVGDILAKSQGSNSPLNAARATIQAIESLRSFEEVAKVRGLTVQEMLHAK